MKTLEVNSMVQSSTAVAARGTRQALGLTDIMLLRAIQSQATKDRRWNGTWQQLHVWFEGPVNRESLRHAIACLGALYPVVTSRLAEVDGTDPYWQFRQGAECLLHEIDLEADEDQAALECAERELARPVDFDSEDPISFHLVRLRSGRELFVVRFDHLLMDGRAMGLVLRELNRLHIEGLGAHPLPDDSQGAAPPLTKKQRRDVVKRIIGRRWRFRGRTAVKLARRDRSAVPDESAQFAIRRLDADQTRRWKARTVELAGFPCHSMGLIASIFRSLRLHGWPQRPEKQSYCVDVGTSLRDPKASGPIFCNLASATRFCAMPEDLDDRGQLIRELNKQLFSIMKLGRDPMQVFDFARSRNGCRPKSWLARVVQRALMANYWKTFSCRYGFLDHLFDEEYLCGGRIERLYALAKCRPEQGFSFLANEYGGKLELATVYIPSVVPHTVIHAFLDAIVEDLLA